MGNDFFDFPQSVGISTEKLVRLDHAREHNRLSPELLPYLDLVESSELWLPDAVIQIDGRAVMYIIRPDALGGEKLTPPSLASLIRVLACRGDARFLGVAEPGRLSVYPIGIYQQEPASLGEISLQSGNTALHDFLSGQLDVSSQFGLASNVSGDTAWLDNFLFDLLTATAEQLKYLCSRLSDGEILSLIGRCLFVRFIADRKIISDRDAIRISPAAASLDELLATPKSTACTFKWLDTTFDGNILPLFDIAEPDFSYESFFEDLGGSADAVCKILNNIMHRAPGGQLELFWDGILFQHVPADMLSQIYEHFAHAYQSKHAKSTSIHYTPRHIAQQLVDAAFSGITTSSRDQCKVLDPSSGAGVFLVLAFKRLVQESWKITGKRPNRSTIRTILNKQVFGFDINKESLKFAALSLYLTALELDPEPTPLDDLRFNRLTDNTLLYVGEGSPLISSSASQVERKLGSLSECLRLPEGVVGDFDIVLGNPPWTELGSTYKPLLDRQVRRIAKQAKIGSQLVAQLKVDNGVPDIPFIWRALEWAKPGGMIAYALHAQHLLFRQGNSAVMRKALFQCIEITGILNASALRNESKIWPNITAPFCFLVAKNQKPNNESSFYYLSPSREKKLNELSLFRVDPQAAISISQLYAVHTPWLFKTLARGSNLDLEVTAKIAGLELGSLGSDQGDSGVTSLGEQEEIIPKRQKLADYWGRHNLKNRDGVQNASAKTAKDAGHLHGLPYLTKYTLQDYTVDTRLLPLFEQSKLYSLYDKKIFSAPLVLFRESPKKQRAQRGAIVAYVDLIYRETFFGHSCAGHAMPELLAKFIQLISLSDVFTYWTLMTSSKYGIERDAILKEDVDAFPIIALESLTSKQVDDIESMSRALTDHSLEWERLDKFMGGLYGLNRADLSLIKDTLSVGLPYSDNKDYAEKAPVIELDVFVSECNRILGPFAARMGKNLKIGMNDHSLEGWRFIDFIFDTGDSNFTDNTKIQLASKVADHFWASQIRIYDSENRLIVGQILQNRYWTKTRARMLALELLNSDFINGNGNSCPQGATKV